MNYHSNAQEVIKVLGDKLLSLAQTDQLVRTCATTALGMMKMRIHEQGKDANGNQIGTYSKRYMAVRTGAFVNAKRVTRGKNTGKLKDAGIFSKGSNKGNARPRYHRTSDTRVILSLTRQMENDMKVIAIQHGRYGIGYSNTFNFQKSQWNEARYKKPIFSLSADEQAAVNEVAKKIVHDALS